MTVRVPESPIANCLLFGSSGLAWFVYKVNWKSPADTCCPVPTFVQVPGFTLSPRAKPRVRSGPKVGSPFTLVATQTTTHATLDEA